MNVLSLFDGMSCGQLALKKTGIKVDQYYAAEIDKYAIQIAQKNFPNTIQLGDVTKVKASDLPKIDLLIGGSPCQGFSFAGKQLNFDDPRSALFFEFVRLLKECQPKYFLLENVRMKKEFQNVITEYLGVEPILINSSLLSAQNRQRLYWTNIPNVTIPEDKGILLKDVLQDYVEEKYLVGQELQKKYQGGNQLNPSYKSQANTIHDINNKSGTLCAGTHGYANGYVPNQQCGRIVGRYIVDGKRMDHKQSVAGLTTQRLEVRNDEKTNTLSTVRKDNVIVEDKYFMNEKQIEGVMRSNYRDRKPMNIHKKSNCLKVGGDIKRIINHEQRWRYLTPIECERLQTVPDNYTDGVSNTQRYKMLGNGWTVDVISHIFQNLKEGQ